MRDLTDDISYLAGCGPKTIKKLNLCGIYTYGDLLKYKGLITDVPIVKLQNKAKAEICMKKQLSEHSWKNHTAHIIRSKGQVTRVKIDTLIISPHRILLNVLWREKGKTRRKSVSPMSVLCVQAMWTSNDILSDDSDEESCDFLQSLLPVFSLDPYGFEIKNLKPTEAQALASIIKEINQFHACVLTQNPQTSRPQIKRDVSICQKAQEEQRII